MQGRVDLLGLVFSDGVGFCVGFSILTVFGALTKFSEMDIIKTK